MLIGSDSLAVVVLAWRCMHSPTRSAKSDLDVALRLSSASSGIAAMRVEYSLTCTTVLTREQHGNKAGT